MSDDKEIASMVYKVPFSFENPNYGVDDDTFDAFIIELQKHPKDSQSYLDEDEQEEDKSFDESIPYTYSIPFSLENPHYGAEDETFNAFIADLLKQPNLQSKPILALKYADQVSDTNPDDVVLIKGTDDTQESPRSVPFSFENPNYGAEDETFNAFIADLLKQPNLQSKPTLALEYTDQYMFVKSKLSKDLLVPSHNKKITCKYGLQVSDTNTDDEIRKETCDTQQPPCPLSSKTGCLSSCRLSIVSTADRANETVKPSVSSCSLTTVSALSYDSSVGTISLSTSIYSITSAAVQSYHLQIVSLGNHDNKPIVFNESISTTPIAAIDENCGKSAAREEATDVNLKPVVSNAVGVDASFQTVSSQVCTARQTKTVPSSPDSTRPSRFKRWRRNMKNKNIFSGYMCGRIIQWFAINNVLL